MGSACELECEIVIAFDLALIPESVYDETLASLVEVKRMLSGPITQLAVHG